ncbi:MAG: hypothetical protein HGA45_35690, partial [Chloroflexales bacterium]|nr:hypothetical protein [Chloroflexales bacterium]
MAQIAKLPAAGNTRPPRQQTYELEIAVVAVGAVTALYIWGARAGTPAASDFFGHSLGVVGFLLMLATETLYSLRKRARGRAIGRLSTWLQWHIVMGIVGSYMVLLHTAWQFQGLAGVVTLLTAVVVLSGFVGRYIYTAIPRTLDGAEQTLGDLERRRARAPRRVPVQQVVDGPVIRLDVERKHLTNLIKMVAYQAESDLLRAVAPHYRRV